MRWGVRKDKGHPDAGNRKAAKKTPEQLAARRRNLKIAGGVGVLVAVGVGAYMAKGLLNDYGGMSKATLPKFASRSKGGSKAANKALQSNPELKARALAVSRRARSGNTSSLMGTTSKQLGTAKAANTQMKSWFNQNNVPIKDRSYIDLGPYERILGRGGG
jgi:hypothetical protein